MKLNQGMLRLAAVAAGSVALVLTATPAQAGVLEAADVSGDVVLWSPTGPESNRVILEPGWDNGDISGMRARHGRERVKARLDFKELSRDVAGIFHTVKIRTSAGRVYRVEVLTGEDDWQGFSDLWRPWGVVRCRGLRHDVDYSENVVRVSIPRACLGRPRWIRIGGDTVTYEETGVDEMSRRSDDALRIGQDGDLPRDTAWSEGRVRRG